MESFSKMALFIKNLIIKTKEKYNSINIKVRKTINLSLGVVVIAIILNMNFSLGYSVFLNNEHIGNSLAKSDIDKMIEDINNTYAPYYSGEDVVDETPAYALKLIKKGDVSTQSELLENIKKSTGKMVKQTVICVDGNDLAGVMSFEEAYEALEICKNSYIEEGTDGCEIKSKVEIAEKYAPSILLTSSAVAANNLCDNDYFEPIKILTYEINKYEDEIAFETEKIQSADVYEGNTKVYQKGENGINVKTVRTEKINGVYESENVISNKVEKSATKQVLLVGTKPRPAGVGTGSFMMPYGGNITSRYGQRGARTHKGIDIVGPVGSKIYAADDGVVTYADYEDGGYGNIVKINHNNGYETFYAHCHTILVKSGEIVKKGDVIATVGNTGRSTGAHLHFEIRENGSALNPMQYIK